MSKKLILSKNEVLIIDGYNKYNKQLIPKFTQISKETRFILEHLAKIIIADDIIF